MSITLQQTRRLPRLSSASTYMLGFVLFVGGCGIVVSALVDAIDRGPHTIPLALTGLAVGLPGLLLWRTTEVGPLGARSVFSAVTVSWIGLSVAATIPYLATGTFVRFDDALFEAISGFTTTGATILAPIEGNSAGILFWRAMTQWFGGMGVIVLAVAILPLLGVGGLELLQAEAPGPVSTRLAPRIRETARRLWMLYLGLTIAVAVAYMLAGMSPYDAVAHTFTTVSTGGFSPYNASIAHFQSSAIEWIAIVAMFLAGGNFALYWRVIRGRPLDIWRAPEARAYGLIVAGMCVFAVLWNIPSQGLSHEAVRQTLFSVISVGTTTGYAVTDWNLWPVAVQLVLLFAMGLGGMTGSTAGGLKVFRLVAILSYARAQIVRQLHPRSIAVVRLGREAVPEEIVARVVGFFGLFMALGAVGTFVVAASGTDMVTAISAAAASIGNVGPGLAEVGPVDDYVSVPHVGRAVLAMLMLVGRLEIMPIILTILTVRHWLRRRVHRPIAPRAQNRSVR